MEQEQKNQETAIEKFVQSLVEQGREEIIIRTGTVDHLSKPENVVIKGAIDAVSRFIEYRKETIDVLTSHAIVNMDERTIKFTANETNSNGEKIDISGSIETSKIFDDLGINSTCRSYSPVELANKLKLLRSIFPKATDHAMIVTTLRNLKAKINKQIEDADDQKGNITKHFEQTVESNMPDKFEIRIPLLKGGEHVTFDINVILEARGHEIICFLESVDAAELIDSSAQLKISEEVEKIKEFTTVIFQ